MRFYRARHHKYLGVGVPEDARDVVLQRHATPSPITAGPSRAHQVASSAVEQAAAAEAKPLVGLTPETEAFLGPPPPPITTATAVAEPPGDEPPKLKPYVPVIQPNRRVRTLPAGTTLNIVESFTGGDKVIEVQPPLPVVISQSPFEFRVGDDVAQPPLMSDYAQANSGPLDPNMPPPSLRADAPQVILISGAVPPPPAPLADATLADLPIGKAPFEFLSGTAGTGKTTVARKFLELSPPGSVVLAATTGIAAVNLGEGTTINSLLGFFNTADLQDKYTSGQLHGMLRNHRRAGLRRILLDEVSMMDARQLTMIVRAIQEINEPKDRQLEAMSMDAEEETPAGELPPQIGLTLVGDFAQLSPVPDRDEVTNKSLGAQFAFESPEWGLFAPHTTKLTKIWRQDAKDFIEALHAIRRGDGRRALQFFTPQRFSDFTDHNFDGTTIFAKNVEVDRFNELRLDKLTTPQYQFDARRWARQRSDWKQIPDRLYLKDGALVMVLANGRDPETKEMLYANGDLGVVVEKTSAFSVRVKLHRTGEVAIIPTIRRENTIPLGPGRRKQLKEAGESHLITKDGKSEIVGTVEYMPLRVAYGCTVHKCLLAGTRVPVVGRGLLPVEEIRVSDVVLSGRGHQCRVIAAQPTGMKELVIVKFTSGRELSMSPDHPLFDGTSFIVGAKPGQRVQLGSDLDQAKWDVPLPSYIPTPRGAKTTKVPDVMSAPLAWWLGAVLGDGSIRDWRDGTIEFHAREKNLVEIFVDYTRALFHVEPRRYPNKVYVISKAVRQWLDRLGLHYVTSESKEVPECIMRAPVAIRGHFLAGLFDTDGCVDARGMRYVTTSRRLATQVQQLLDSLGVTETKISSQVPTLTYRGAKRQGLRAYTVTVYRKGVEKLYRRVRLMHLAKGKMLAALVEKPVRELPINADHGKFDTIGEVVKTGLQVPLHDLEVEDDHSFIANGLVVSNTQGLTLDKVQVNIRDGFFKTPGMLFVALSRARSAEGLRIVGQQIGFFQRCTVNPLVVPWL